MKTKYSIIISVLSIGFTLSGCSKFLDKQPISQLTEDQYYQNTDQVETAVLGCYAALRNVYNYDYVLAGLRSDDSYISVSDGDINQIDAFVDGPTNSYTAAYWQNAYFTIKQCNTVLKYLGNVTDTTKKKYFEAEAKFIRAHMYFNLVRLFGPVPLVNTSVAYNDNPLRSDSATIYASIIADLKIGIQQLPSSWDPSQAARVSVYAAKAMLAKVYLTQNNYAASFTLLQDLITNPGPYQLLASYKSIFGGSTVNAEVMYAVYYKSNSNGMGETYTYQMDKISGSVGFRSASDFRGSSVFVTADSIRKNTTFTTYASGTGSLSYYDVGKYQDPGAPKNDAGAPFIILRYADVVLMYAEVYNELNGPPTSATANIAGLTQLNRIRQRANPSATTLVYAYNNAAVNTKTSFRTTIKAERRREFGIEDQRWYDLLRWGDAITAMNAHFQSRASASFTPPVLYQYQVLYPIPQREIDISQHVLTQNPGY